MRLALIEPLLALLIWMGFSMPVFACTLIPDERSALLIRSQSKPVTVDKQCRVLNAGVYDNYSLGRARDLGNGRVFQFMDESVHQAMLVDCHSREATIIRGKIMKTEQGPCAVHHTYQDLRGSNKGFLFTQANSLAALEKIARAHGAGVLNPKEQFFRFRHEKTGRYLKAGRKDVFDLLCGCKLYYPDSAGAKL